MTITITIPETFALPDGVGRTIRVLLPLVEPVVLAIAAACGAGFVCQLGLNMGFKLAGLALQY